MKLIGIVMRIEQFDSVNKWFMNEAYVHAIIQLGAAVFPICSYTSLEKAILYCDGFIIPGGYDIQSYYLHEIRNKNITTYDKAMDHFDFTCIHALVQAKKPILGICRGMQLLNVYFKGTLTQHIEQHGVSHTHPIDLEKDSFLTKLYPEETIVNSFHHQIVSTLGKGLKSSAKSKEGYIEAMEHENGLVYGVQWHPEKMENDQVLPYFLDIVCT